MRSAVCILSIVIGIVGLGEMIVFFLTFIALPVPLHLLVQISNQAGWLFAIPLLLGLLQFALTKRYRSNGSIPNSLRLACAALMCAFIFQMVWAQFKGIDSGAELRRDLDGWKARGRGDWYTVTAASALRIGRLKVRGFASLGAAVSLIAAARGVSVWRIEYREADSRAE